MSIVVNSSRHLTINRTASSHRQVVVPDRTIVKRGKGASPIINLQSSALPTPTPAVHKKQPSAKRLPIASSKVHKLAQKDQQKQAVRPVKRQVEVSEAMSSMLERRNALPKHLARAAGRAHLLSQVLQAETPPKLRWHQRILSGLTSQ